MIIQCPRCQIKLTIEEKTPETEGAIFKCSKCRAVFLAVQRPFILRKKMLARGKITTIKSTKPGERAEPRGKPIALTALDEQIEKAKMLAKTIVSDLYHYNPEKTEQSIRNHNFYSAFESELKEGLELYESRILPEVREKGDFFREAVEDFIIDKKKTL